MKKLILIGIAAAAVAGCDSAPRPVANTNAANTAVESNRSERSETVIAHSSENQPPASMPAGNSTAPGSKGKWTQSGDPIDTKEFDAAIASAEKEAKAKPSDGAAKKALGDAYMKRAVALTEARQYASALGDYRRVVKNDPENEEAKNWIDQIITIYSSLGRTPPPEGEEPPPLPFGGEKK
jgi:tetratricopeptide (TPR) repeat protein